MMILSARSNEKKGGIVAAEDEPASVQMESVDVAHEDNNKPSRKEDDRQVIDEEENQPAPAVAASLDGAQHYDWKDHWTLDSPGCTVQHSGCAVHVHDLKSCTQLQLLRMLDDTPGGTASTTVIVKNVVPENMAGVNFLRAIYTIVCVLFAGILFILCFMVLLFLFMDLVGSVGANEQRREIGAAIGTFLALPILVQGLASAMAIAVTLATDTWAGHSLLQQMGGYSIVATEWAVMTVFLVIPVLALIITLFAGYDNWWEISTIVWFSCIASYYVFFAFSIIYYETLTAWSILKELKQRDDGTGNESTFGALLLRAMVQCQRSRLSGNAELIQTTENYWNQQQEDENDGPQDNNNITEMKNSCYAKFTLKLTALFEQLEPPKRLKSTEDVLGTRQFVTASNWSLERIFCWNRHRDQTISVIKGPSALLPSQMMSSLVCFLLGFVLILLLLVSFLLWVESLPFLILAVIICLLCYVPLCRSNVRAYRMYQDVVKAKKDDADNEHHTNDEETDLLYQTYERYRVTQPNIHLCWILFAAELGFLVVWPLVTIYVTKNIPVATLFLVVSIVTISRNYLNACALVKELGSFERIGCTEHGSVSTDEATTTGRHWSNEQWRTQSRLSAILINVARKPRRRVWTWIFSVFVVIIVFFAIASATSSNSEDDSTTESPMIKLLPAQDFFYEPLSDGLRYPTCRLSKGLDLPGNRSVGLADYAFTSLLTYESNNTIVQEMLDGWFGEGVAKTQPEIIERFRGVVTGGTAPIKYGFITFNGNVGLVVVRGSTTAWEWLTDAQLWGGVAFVQLVRSLLPLGFIWTPILDNLLKAISWVQSENLQRSALYQQTTTLVRALKERGNFTSLQISGHSLGGGITLITSAQNEIPGVAVSGPNCMLLRKTFDPPIPRDAINKYTFNIVPERDIVPKVDDVGDMHQRIRCNSPKNNLWGCHSIVRSLCEIMYTCGTTESNRPTICECATKYGYPEPNATGSRTFTELCGSERSNE